MRRIWRKRKGFTLIEVVISAAILTILMIPIASITITAIKTSNVAEDKQKATQIGQQLLDEIKSFDSVSLTAADTFQLLNGQRLEATRDPATSKIIQIDPIGATDNFNVTDEQGVNYDVKLVLTRVNEASYDPQVAPTIAGYNQSLYFGDGQVNVNDDITDDSVTSASTHTINGRTNLFLNIDNNFNIQINDGGTLYPSTSKLVDIPLTTAGRILVKIDDKMSGSNEVTLKLNSTYTGNTTIDVIKENRDSGNVTVQQIAHAGNVDVYYNVSTQVPETLGDLYRINIVVSRTGTDVLFEGEATKNIKIK